MAMKSKCYLLLYALFNISLTHEAYIRSKYAIDEFDDEVVGDPVEVRDVSNL